MPPVRNQMPQLYATMVSIGTINYNLVVGCLLCGFYDPFVFLK